MSLINHEELKKQLASGEITSHLGYDKHQASNSTNFRNGYNEKTIKSKYGNIGVAIPRESY